MTVDPNLCVYDPDAVSPSLVLPTPIEPLRRIAKADLWRRLSDEEAELLDAALKAAPVRLRHIFEAAQFIDKDDPDFSALRDGIVAALGEERAEQVLETEDGE